MLDITLRALVTLRTNFILCENPKITKKLLFHYRINNKPHKLNLANVRIAIKSKHNVCVVSDSGTPLVCDPGYKAVKALCDAKYKLISVPGACAVTCALVCAQMPTNKYLFVGFLPKSKQRAKTQLISYISTGIALIAFESPRRIKTTIKTLIEIAGGDLKISVCIELTKFNEKIVKGRAQDVYNQLYQLVPMGEITLLVWSKTVTHCVRDAIFNKIAKYIKSTPL